MLKPLQRDGRPNGTVEVQSQREHPKIIIADNDQTLVQMLTIRCKQLGLDVFPLPDAMHALLGVHRLRPHFLLLDINMPGGNGLNLCEMLISDETLAETSIVVMSGKSDENVAESYISLGVRHVRKGPDLWNNLSDLICERLGLESVNGDEKIETRSAQECDDLSPTITPKVLCIEDDPEISKAIKIRLEPYGVDVRRAFSGMQGFWTALDCQPQLIISDLSMPDGDGNYINGRLKSHPVTKDIPVVILTGQANVALKREMLSLGAVAYLEKPLHFPELLEVLESYIPLKHSSEQLIKT